MKQVAGTALLTIAFSYAVIVASVIGFAHPFMEQAGDCKRACMEARGLIDSGLVGPVTLAAIGITLIGIGLLIIGTPRR